MQFQAEKNETHHLKKIRFVIRIKYKDCGMEATERPYHLRLSPSFNTKINTKYSENLAFVTRMLLCWPISIFQNDLNFLNFLISPENRDLF